VLREWRVEPGAGDGGPLEKPGEIALARGGHWGLLAWCYTTDGLVNFDFDVIRTADSSTEDVMLVVIATSSCCLRGLGVVGYELLEDGDNRALIQKIVKKK
jgi:hypothetical protein